jgi:hypothetical protein
MAIGLDEGGQRGRRAHRFSSPRPGESGATAEKYDYGKSLIGERSIFDRTALSADWVVVACARNSVSQELRVADEVEDIVERNVMNDLTWIVSSSLCSSTAVGQEILLNL